MGTLAAMASVQAREGERDGGDRDKDPAASLPGRKPC